MRGGCRAPRQLGACGGRAPSPLEPVCIVAGEERIPAVSTGGAHAHPRQAAPGPTLPQKRLNHQMGSQGFWRKQPGKWGDETGTGPLTGGRRKMGPGTKRFPQVNTTHSVFWVDQTHLPALRTHHSLLPSSCHKSRPEGLYQDQTRIRKNELPRRRRTPCLPLWKVNLRTRGLTPGANELILNPLPP